MSHLPRRTRHAWRPGRDPKAERHRGPAGTPTAQGQSAIVVGGGIAGLSAATELAERGVAVTLIEQQPQLGGRVASWPVELSDGSSTRMSRGFHAFFRQYYQLRALLRRADPQLQSLRPVDDYPLQHSSGTRDSFAGLPTRPPWNVAGFVARSPSFPLSRLADVDLDQALGLLDLRFPESYSDLDGVSASALLDRLRFPLECRHLALEVFARSFFAHPDEFAGGELLAMFHSYFVGSSEGLLFDVTNDDFDTALWAPLSRYLLGLDVELRLSTTAEAISVEPDRVTVIADGEELSADALVLATDLRPMQQLLRDAADRAELHPADPDWSARVARQPAAPPFAVWRLWLDQPARTGSPDFLGTSGYGPLDNVSMIHQFEVSAANWAAQHGGSVVELHAYALAEDHDPDQVRQELRRQLDRLHPELSDANLRGEQWLVRSDCSFPDLSPWRDRPEVSTSSPRLVLAGDGIRCPYPVALMERAATTGVLAANQLLSFWGASGSDIWTTPTTPRLAWATPARRLTRALRGRPAQPQVIQ